MKLEPLYRLRFRYSESWGSGSRAGGSSFSSWQRAAARASLNGRFRGVNFPQRRTAAGPFVPDIRAVIETDDGSSIMFECHGYGRAYPAGRRQIVGSVMHLSDSERYRRLNDVVCVCVGQVRATDDAEQEGPDLVIDVAELIWEPIAD